MNNGQTFLPIPSHLITKVPDKLFFWDREGYYLAHHYLHPNLKHFVGPPGFLHKHVCEVLPPEIGEGLLLTIKEAFRTLQGQSYHFELPLEGIPYRQFVRLLPQDGYILGLVYDSPVLSFQECHYPQGGR